MRVIIPLGSPVKVFETAITTILRVIESYDTDEILLLYPPFVKYYLNEITDFLTQFNLRVKVSVKQITYDIPQKEIDEIISSSDLLIPSASSVIYIIKFVESAVKHGVKIDHVMFPFGPWYGLYYPFVPRFIVPLFGGKGEVNKIDFSKVTIGKWLKGRELSKIIASLSLEFNTYVSKNYKTRELPNFCITKEYKFTDEVKNSLLCVLRDSKITYLEKEISPEDLMKLLFNDKKDTLAKVFGFYSLRVIINDKDYDLREIVRKYKGVLIDTNLIYNGIAFYPDIQTLLPYCAYIEISNNRSNFKHEKAKKIADDLAWIYLQELLSRSQMIPTQAFFCDPIIPMIDPLLINDALILSSDEAVIEHWKNVISNAEVARLSFSPKRDYYELVFSVMLLTWMLKNSM